MSQFFNTSIGVPMSSGQVCRAIVDFMKEDRDSQYNITLGTDSEKASDDTADFVTAIVVHRIGRGARYFWRRIGGDEKYHTLRTRITREVTISLEMAQAFLLEMGELESPKYDFAIHLDIGENGATRTMIQELVGMIRGYNFNVKIKPDSYAATNVADKHV
ncbi:MAG: ribonuclease H-like YkuK family protein [bacterium]|nr:ribonuclease H-like YkuK family protein [bacterium]